MSGRTSLLSGPPLTHPGLRDDSSDPACRGSSEWTLRALRDFDRTLNSSWFSVIFATRIPQRLKLARWAGIDPEPVDGGPPAGKSSSGLGWSPTSGRETGYNRKF